MEIEKTVILELCYTLFVKSTSLSLYIKLYWFFYIKKRENLQWVIEIKMQTHVTNIFGFLDWKK